MKFNKAQSKGSFIWVLNDQGENLFSFSIQRGRDNYGDQITEEAATAMAEFMRDAFNITNDATPQRNNKRPTINTK
ncbi:MAG: hypothetical protein JKY34_11275 [Kordiimonadaceae bacterium]|nr:hypothetical protein [Kordiimonadaceae bacterium]